MIKPAKRSTRAKTEHPPLFENQQQALEQIQQHLAKKRRVEQIIQTFVSLHIATILGLVLAGLFIVVQLGTGHGALTDPDTENYMLYVKIYLVLFLVSAGSYLVYVRLKNQSKQAPTETRDSIEY